MARYSLCRHCRRAYPSAEGACDGCGSVAVAAPPMFTVEGAIIRGATKAAIWTNAPGVVRGVTFADNAATIEAVGVADVVIEDSDIS